MLFILKENEQLKNQLKEAENNNAKFAEQLEEAKRQKLELSKQLKERQLSTETTAVNDTTSVEKCKNCSNKLDLSHLEIQKNKVLGTGSFGKVYYGKYFKSPVAIKKLKLNDEFYEDFNNEIQILM